jgi:hypothetical protein
MRSPLRAGRSTTKPGPKRALHGGERLTGADAHVDAVDVVPAREGCL